MNFSAFIASGGGVGYAPRAPGTAGSILGLLIGAVLLGAGHTPLALGIAFASCLGIWAVSANGAATDPGWIVIDEIAGQMIAMLALHRVTLLGLAVAFGLFRLFDIVKPGPVGWADARHDEWGVMGDDWIAGGLAFAGIVLLRLILPGHWS